MNILYIMFIKCTYFQEYCGKYLIYNIMDSKICIYHIQYIIYMSIILLYKNGNT